MYRATQSKSNLFLSTMGLIENSPSSYFNTNKSNFLQCCSIQMVHSIELKFGMYITVHCRTNSVDFGENRMNSFFFTGVRNNSYTLRIMESNSLKCSSIQMVHSIEFKFGIYIIGHRPTYCVEFGEISINSSFIGA